MTKIDAYGNRVSKTRIVNTNIFGDKVSVKEVKKRGFGSSSCRTCAPFRSRTYKGRFWFRNFDSTGSGRFERATGSRCAGPTMGIGRITLACRIKLCLIPSAPERPRSRSLSWIIA